MAKKESYHNSRHPLLKQNTRYNTGFSSTIFMKKIQGSCRDMAFIKEAMVKVYQTPQSNLKHRFSIDRIINHTAKSIGQRERDSTSGAEDFK